MDNLALSVSKSITDFLEQNEKRFVSQHSQQEQHDQLLNNLKTKIEQLELKCDGLANENKELRIELETLKQREDATSRGMITTQSDIEKMHKQVEECNKWVELITTVAERMSDLNNSKNSIESAIKSLIKTQSTLVRKAQNQQSQIDSAMATANAAAATAAAVSSAPTTVSAPHYSIINRTPMRSPSTSSFFNGNMNSHSSIPRHKHHSSNNNHHRHYQSEDYEGSLDVNDEMSELSENAESLLREVQVLEELHKSFEQSSICSDGPNGR